MTASRNAPGGMGSKILLLAIVPVLSISVILTWYYTNWRQAHLEQDLQLFGQWTAQYLAVASNLAMFADDLESLQQIGRGASNIPAVQSVGFFNEDGSPLLNVGQTVGLGVPALLEEAQWLNNQHRDSLFWYFRAPVELGAESVTDYSESVEGTGQLLGWAVVALSQEELYQTQRDNLWISFVISIITTLLVSVAAWRLSHRIYQPVRDLTGVVETMEAGDLTVQARDIGEREVRILARVINRLASRLNQTNIHLKQEVDEATGDLRKALTDLEQALGAKDQFLARMSHELRTPLTTILGFTRRLDHTPQSVEQSEYTHAIQHSSVLLLSVINDILDFSRLQYSGISLEEVEFDLEEQLEDIVSLHAYCAYEKSIELILFIDSDVPRFFLGDAARLKQILNNLLANSVKFTQTGEIIVHVVQHQQADDIQLLAEYPGPGGTVTLEISVRDSGIGIPEEDLEKLFKPFSQADTSINRRFGGSGLGLVICQQLVELMGGEISIDSEQDSGTTVRFTVPLQRADKDNEDLSLPQRTESVAIIDRNRWSRRALRGQATHWTRQVFAVADTSGLIELITQKQYEFSIVLISLGPGDLLERPLLHSLAALRSHYRGPIILMACQPNVPVSVPERVLRDYAPLWYLAKPVRKNNLLEWLDAVGDNSADLTEQENSQLPTDSPAEGCLAGLSILIAEDNLFNQKLFKTLLEKEDATTVVADNGAQAVEHFQQSDCTLVLMDAHMPLLDGVQACRQIVAHACETGRDVTVIGLTADTLDHKRQQFLDAGAREVLYKPVDEDALLEALCRYAGKTYHGQKDVSILSANASKTALTQELLKQVANLRRALDMGQLIDSRETLHQLMGLSGMYGMVEFRQLVMDLRDSMVRQQGTEVQQKLTALEAFVSRTFDQGDH